MKKLMLFIFLNLFLIMGVDASEFSMWTDTLDPNLNYEKIECKKDIMKECINKK